MTLAVGRTTMVHTAAYILERGPLPAGKRLANRCGRRACVNPEHWEAATRSAVARRAPGGPAVRA